MTTMNSPIASEINSTLAIEVQNLNIAFNGVQILHNMHFSLRSAEVHGLIGANGAGKSTLMKILNGVYHHSSGTIKLFGYDAILNSPIDARESGIAMVYQDLSLVSTLTVAENIFLSSNPYLHKSGLLNKKQMHAHSSVLLSQVGVDANIYPSDLVGDLSPGQQQIVEIVKALASSPKILILDEPTASLSVKEIKSFFKVISRLKEQGISVIYITHYLQDVLRICDCVTVLRDGRNVLESRTANVDIAGLVKSMVGSAETRKIWKKRNRSTPDEIPLFEIRNIKTSRIKNASLSVNKGEVVGIAGLLGSGRTELFDALCGVDSIISGEVFIENKLQKIQSSTQAVKIGISLIPEDRRERGLILDFSVQENMIMSVLDKFKKLFYLNLQTIVSHVDEKIQSLNIKIQNAFQKVRLLSGGNQQKVVVGKCLSTNSRVLLLDDPTFGVDVHSKQEIMSIIRDFVGKGNAAVFVSSEFKELAEFCDSVYIMKHSMITDHLVSDSELTEETILYHVQ